MIRTAIYARYSSDSQNERSCDDQVAWCAKWAAKQDLDIILTYRDEAISGAHAANRPGLSDLMYAARQKRFDAVVCEDLDRLARNQADLHRVRQELAFLGIRLMTVSDGTITAMNAGLKGLMSEMFLTELGNKTRRGLQARVAAGASAGGVSYGYAADPTTKGKHIVNEREAAVVRRIFADYVAGATPRDIAHALNDEGIPAPRGGKWNSSTLNGSKARANGILQNRLYIGELVWNRQRFVKNPKNGKRVSRLNPESDWLRADVPELAIVDRAIFARSLARKEERSADRGPVGAKPRHMLSGLTKCGCCGASYTVMGNDRIGCSGFRERGDCTNNRTVTRAHVEERVLAAMESYLAAPEVIAAYVAEYHATRRALRNTRQSERDALTRKLSDLESGIERLVDAIVAGTAGAAIASRLAKMEADRDELRDQLGGLVEDDNTIVLHPAAADSYIRIIRELRLHLEGIREGQPRDELLEKLRALIDRVTITPNGKAPVDIKIHGVLAELLVPEKGTPLNAGAFRGALVAGARITRAPKFVLAA